MNFTHQYYIIVGHYGSGKTELSLALARYLNQTADGKVALVDLDIVNPYFRSTKHKDLLNKEGIDVKSPTFALSSVDLPVLPPDIQSVFESGQYRHVVIDVGGDDTGATALGRYYPQIQPIRDQVQMLYIINPFRPLSGNVDAICDLFALVEKRARIRPDLLVNNANLQRQTTVQQLLKGQELIERAAKRLSVPVGMVVGYPHLKNELPESMRKIFFSMMPMMLPEWLEDDFA